jgi:hypothetical protein
MHHHHSTGFADRYKSQNNDQYTPSNGGTQRQPYHHSNTSVGAFGHWIHLINVATPLVISEVVKDADKKWRYLRLASVGGAIVSEAAWTLKVAHDRKEREESRAELDACREQHCR